MKNLFLFFINVFVCLANAQEWQNYSTLDGLISNHINTICFDKNGNLWFGTDNGLSFFNGISWQSYQMENGLINNDINDLAYENLGDEAKLWIATEGGVSVLNINDTDTTFTESYTSDDSDLLSDKVLAIEVENDLVKWFATDSGINSLKDEIWGIYTKETHPDSFYSDYVQSIGIDIPIGMRYFGTITSGISRVKDSLDAYTAASYWFYKTGLTSLNVTAVHIMDNHTQWYGTDYGINEHRSTLLEPEWYFYYAPESDSDPPGPVDDYIHAIDEDSEGALWIGTQGGLSSYHNSTWIAYTAEDGLIDNDVLDVAVDMDDNIWCATANGVSYLILHSVSIEEQKPPVHNAHTFELLNNYPNPFNLSTNIRYQLAAGGKVNLDIYNVKGQKIISLVNRYQETGYKEVIWNGINSDGFSVTSGVYFARIQFQNSRDKYSKSAKLLLIK